MSLGGKLSFPNERCPGARAAHRIRMRFPRNPSCIPAGSQCPAGCTENGRALPPAAALPAPGFGPGFGVCGDGDAGREPVQSGRVAGATALIVGMAAESSPSVAFVGHGPDRPNTLHHDGFYSSPPIADISPYPYVLPYGIPPLPSRGSRRFNNQLFCVAQTMQASASFSPVFITAYPDVMPPRRFTR